eukprot:scaffold13334_cov207-Alexandrium_tamarense.AAC.3
MASTVTMCVRRDATVGTMVDEHKVHGRGLDERDIHILSSSNLTIGIANLHSVWAISHLYTTSISLQLCVVLSAEGVCVERSLSSAVCKGACSSLISPMQLWGCILRWGVQQKLQSALLIALLVRDSSKSTSYLSALLLS